MEPVAIPKTIDDPIHLLLWSANEIVPFMVCMLTGMLIDQFIPALAFEVMASATCARFSGRWGSRRASGSGILIFHSWPPSSRTNAWPFGNPCR